MSRDVWIDSPALPTVPGLYAVELGAGQRAILVHWAEGQTDWRDGAVRIRTRRWCGPLPPIPRPAMPEKVKP